MNGQRPFAPVNTGMVCARRKRLSGRIQMLGSRLLATALLILAAVLALSSCSGTSIPKPTEAIMTPNPSLGVVAATGMVTRTAPPTAIPTDTRLSSPQPAASGNLVTLSPSNSAVVTAIARTPQPTPLLSPLPNETGIMPGQTEAEVEAVLGLPGSKDRYRGMDIWVYRSARDPTLPEVTFSDGRVSEIAVLTPKLTAEMVVSRYGPPELVVFYPQVQLATPEPPPASPRGELVYPSKGLQFEFVCWPTRIPPCKGVPRDVDISVKFYFRPTTIEAWVAQQVLPPGSSELRPWTGFSE